MQNEGRMPESLSGRINCFMRIVAAQSKDTQFKMSDELIGWICSLLTDTGFLNIPLELQLSFLAFLHTLQADSRHFHRLSVSIDEAVKRLFSFYMNNSNNKSIQEYEGNIYVYRND